MGFDPVTAAYVVAAVGAAATTYGTMEERKAAKQRAGAEKEARDVNTALQKQQEAEQRRQQIRDQRIRQAQIAQGAANTGASGSSGELGAVSGTQTVTGSNIAFGQSAALAAQGISQQQQVAADASLQGQIAGGIANLGGSLFNIGVQGGALDSLFSSSSTSTTKTK